MAGIFGLVVLGAIVLKPKPGLHENIAVLDFAAMYPNIMITYNISPDTYVAPNEPIPPSGIYEAQELVGKHDIPMNLPINV
ncbi:hypothetical protein H5T51_01650 [Candidatus Bathyarchaeota archaeon]|nr:hypothetical protein [Candidatus Bathyarchaeota archaeon]